LLQPFARRPLTEEQLASLSHYLDLLLRWNARLNLTSVRDARGIVTRHIGESWFAAERLLPDPGACLRAVDVGSGAGFPGLPLKLYAPRLELTLIESQHKKATFLRETIRLLGLSGASVFAGRAETFPGKAELVTLRAVERFEQILPIAAALLDRGSGAAGGNGSHDTVVPPRLALLIGASQIARARKLLPSCRWEEPVSIPQSASRVLAVGVPVLGG
jgi:16S rRNA (guanine527-N7)-methyltransferase